MQENDEEIVVEDPDQIEESQLHKILPHNILRSLISHFKSNGTVIENKNNDDEDQNELLKW